MQPNDSYYQQCFNALKNSKLFGSLDEELIKNLLLKLDIVEWKKNETIDNTLGSKNCYFLVEGRLKITQIDPNTGRSFAPFLLSSGDIFDVFTLLDEKEHTVFPIALDNIIALFMPLKEARECINKYPEFNKQFLPYLGDMMRELENLSSSLVFHDTATRLANLILKHTFSHKDNEYKVKLINNLSHESIAELIGSVRSVITMQLQKLKEEEIILQKRGEIAIKNLEKLIKKIDLLHCKK
jgi:CRP-like cAMP-binding protein